MNSILKSLVLVVGLMLLSFQTHENHLHWQQWNDGFPKAKAENKIALIDTYTAWCGWCKKMDKDTYENPEIVSKINEHFIPIKFNPELPGTYNIGDTAVSGRALLSALSQGGKSSGYPTTFFYLPKQNRMYQYPGYMDAEKFGNLLDLLVQAHTAETEEAN